VVRSGLTSRLVWRLYPTLSSFQNYRAWVWTVCSRLGRKLPNVDLNLTCTLSNYKSRKGGLGAVVYSVKASLHTLDSLYCSKDV
jgi:hypothetical protein